ncbi:MAG: sodium:proton antiporter [Betaproteobacteria bacterium]|nr:MAG: sodium:proton antiporter [Betaproteobacteria bacterium]
MSFAIWIFIVGALLIAVALFGTVLKRLPLSTSMVYLAVGLALSPEGWGLVSLDPFHHSVLLERAAEIAVLISLFAAGMKLSLPFSDKHWHLPMRLALTSMVITVVLIALIGFFALGLSLGAAVLLGAILAPTDPVLASDVQLENATDRDRLRFSLTGEGGLNDGTAFPFVMLGLGLMGVYDLGAFGWRWIAVDLIWAGGAGLLIGALLGTAIGKLVVYLRIEHQEAVGLDEFLVLGLIGISYGAALLAHAYGFLAVFAAGLALQRVRGQNGTAPQQPIHTPATKDEQRELATDPEHAGAYMMQGVRGFNEQLERIAEFAIVLVVGAMLASISLPHESAWFIAFLFLLVRPLAVWLGLLGVPIRKDERLLLSWFGIRGIGSIYYLMFVMNHGVNRELAEYLLVLTLTVVTASIVLHGISVTPLMNAYAGRNKR